MDAAKAALGKRLFFDPRLSGDVAISCSTCHNPEKGFADGLPLAEAYPGSDGFRNAPTLINAAQKAAWFHDGRIGTNLNDVTRESITETYSMNMDMRLMQERVKQDPIYVKMFEEAGFGEPSNGSIRNAIPEYLKTLTSRGAPFDTGKMSDAAKNGFALFTGKAGCSACHTGPRFTDDTPHNTGASENPDIWSNPRRHLTFVAFATFMGIENYMNIRRDVGAHIQREIPETDNCCSIKDLENISDGVKYRISQTLEPGSRGCRLDFNGLANASVSLAGELEKGADLVVLNRFGKGESEGQGFRAIIQKAIELNIPVLTAVRDVYLPHWQEFGGEFAQTIQNANGKGLKWCLASMQGTHTTI